MDAVATRPEHTTEPTASTDASRKYLTFMLNDEEYGIDILRVREIIGLMNITKVPQTHPFVEGVINLRGKVIPVIDLRTKFGLTRAEYNELTCIIVVEVGMLMGIIVDAVQEVLDIAAADTEPAPQLGETIDTDFIAGMGKGDERVKILLDIERVLTDEELVLAQQAGGE